MSACTSMSAKTKPPTPNGLRIRAARVAPDCIRALADIAASERAPAADRVRAAELVLRHATTSPSVSGASVEAMP